MNQKNLPDINAQVPVDELSYEQAFAELEQIVLALETGEHSLDTGVNLFERGQVLARRCTKLLDQAELKVRQLEGENLVDFSPQS